jgi:hypothetical protein
MDWNILLTVANIFATILLAIWAYKTQKRLAKIQSTYENLDIERRKLLTDVINHFWNTMNNYKDNQEEATKEIKDKFFELKKQSILLLPDNVVYVFNAQNRYVMNHEYDEDSGKIILSLFSILLKEARIAMGYDDTNLKSKDLLELVLNKLETLDDIYIKKAYDIINKEKTHYKNIAY